MSPVMGEFLLLCFNRVDINNSSFLTASFSAILRCPYGRLIWRKNLLSRKSALFMPTQLPLFLKYLISYENNIYTISCINRMPSYDACPNFLVWQNNR